MGEIVVSEDGGMSTVEHKVLHSLWPCVPHGSDVSCREAQRVWAKAARVGIKIARVIDAEASAGISG